MSVPINQSASQYSGTGAAGPQAVAARCAGCAEPLLPGADFCHRCGVQQKPRCPGCGKPAAADHRFCNGCGQLLHPPGASPAAAPSPPAAPSEVDHAERRQITFVFCDLVDSTAMASGRDPEEFREIVRAYHEAAVKVVQDYGGHVAQYLGDGLLVYFGYPRAHENAAARALHAAQGVVATLPKLNAALGLTAESPLRVRIGVHTGLVVVGDVGAGARVEQLAIGDAPNIAARLQGVAPPDGIVASAATRSVVREVMDWVDLGEQQLKGVARPLQAFALVSARTALPAPAMNVDTGPIVGREPEEAFIEGAWRSAVAGAGTMVLVTGEPGIGKSRLLAWAEQRVAQDGGRTHLFRCSPYHGASDLHPVIEWLEQALALLPDDGAPVRFAKLESAVLGVPGATTEEVDLMAALLSIPLPAGRAPPRLTPQIAKQRTQAALVRWLLAPVEGQPRMLVFEDLHWADPSTLALIQELTAAVGSHAVLLVTTFRPEFTPDWPAAERSTRLVLERLNGAGVAAMVQRLTGGRELPAAVLQQIVVNSDGVPLFVEEFTRTVLESGVLVERGGRFELRGGDLLKGLIPESLRDSLAARLDRLDAGRVVARHAAVIGRRFDASLVATLCGLPPAQVEAGLDELARAGLVYPVDAHAAADRYEFKHALVQAAAYESLLKRQRQALHAVVASEIDTRQPELAERQPELVAYHLTASHQWLPAVQRWLMAGQRSLARSANAEAITQLRAGLALVEHLPSETSEALELALLSTVGPALIASTGFGSAAVGEVYSRARALCERMSDRPEIFPALWGSAVYHLISGRLEASRTIAEQMLALAQATGDSAQLVEAHATLGNANFWLGDLQRADQHLQQSLALYHPEQHAANALIFGQDPAVAALCYHSYALWAMGLADQSRAALEQARVLADQRDHIFTFGWVIGFSGNACFARREPEQALAGARATLSYCNEHGHPFWAAAAMTVEGWALAQLGQRAEGLARMREGITMYELIGSNCVLPVWLAGLAELELEDGELAAAQLTLERGFAKVRETGERFSEIELWRIQGEWHARQAEPDRAGARRCYEQALTLGERCGAHLFSLRAAVSMHRLLRAAGDRAALATSPLPTLLAGFTEGLDSADLVAARAELAAG